MTYTVHIYYSKHVTSDVEDFEMSHNCGYGKCMTTKKKPIPCVPSPKKAR